jgi:hypothetical protein
VIDDSALEELDEHVVRALATGDESGLRVLGYGEITLVLAWPPDEPKYACKRLPLFAGPAAVDAYRIVLEEYLDLLRASGVDVVGTELRTVTQRDGRIAGYCVQPALDAATVVPAVLRASDPAPEHPAFGAIADAVYRVCNPSTGFDAQLANWVLVDGRLSYLDVTTPMLRDHAGRLRLNADLFLSSFPRPLRAPFRRFVLPGVVERFANPRDVLLDLLGNMHKEQLEQWIPVALDAVNARVSPSITAAEVRKFYANDARLWAAVVRIRRADRWWQRTVRRRPYQFLLPGRIER